MPPMSLGYIIWRETKTVVTVVDKHSEKEQRGVEVHLQEIDCDEISRNRASGEFHTSVREAVEEAFHHHYSVPNKNGKGNLLFFMNPWIKKGGPYVEVDLPNNTVYSITYSIPFFEEIEAECVNMLKK